MWRRGKFDASRRLSNGTLFDIAQAFPLDASYDNLDEVPLEVRSARRYAERGDFTILGLTNAWKHAYGGSSLDIVVHCLANGPEVARPLMDTTRSGYLAAVSASAYSNVSLVRHLAPLMREGGALRPNQGMKRSNQGMQQRNQGVQRPDKGMQANPTRWREPKKQVRGLGSSNLSKPSFWRLQSTSLLLYVTEQLLEQKTNPDFEDFFMLGLT